MHQRTRRAAASLSPGALAVDLVGAVLLSLISAMAPPPQPKKYLPPTNSGRVGGGVGIRCRPMNQGVVSDFRSSSTAVAVAGATIDAHPEAWLLAERLSGDEGLISGRGRRGGENGSCCK